MFFELIKTSVGISWITCTPSSSEWKALYNLSERQAILGITFYGIQKLYQEKSEIIAEMPYYLKIQWIGMAKYIQSRNDVLNRRCYELSEFLRKRDSFHVSSRDKELPCFTEN